MDIFTRQECSKDLSNFSDIFIYLSPCARCCLDFWINFIILPLILNKKTLYQMKTGKNTYYVNEIVIYNLIQETIKVKHSACVIN